MVEGAGASNLKPPPGDEAVPVEADDVFAAPKVKPAPVVDVGAAPKVNPCPLEVDEVLEANEKPGSLDGRDFAVAG